MSWPTSPAAVSGSPIPAAGWNAIRADVAAMNGFVRKTADQSISSSTVLTNDTHLLYAIPAAGTYLVDVYALANSAADAAGDIAVGFSFPAGTMYFMGPGPHNSLASGSNVLGEWIARPSATSGSTNIPFGLSLNGGIPLGFTVHAMFVATASGTLRFMWAQQTSSASATKVWAGSHMLVRQVA